MVYLIGAGPGNPGLITAKGLEILKKCDALVYDRLGTNELLEAVPDTCEKIYVGKRPGAHYRSQEEINEILIETAKKYRNVVRLKGGDPFVFGRGGEEIIALQEGNIPFQVIPGVTSAIAVPELCGIPVTHRASSRGFHVYTGHTKNIDDEQLSYIHKTEGTSVFLMGVAHIDKIVKRLLEAGESPSLPVSVISQGTLPGEKKITGTLENIAAMVREENISSPAIIVAGETAAYSFVSEDISMLRGKKIGAVGTRQFRERMRIGLEELGASLFSLCSMDIRETEQAGEIETELKRIKSYDWLVFTSGNSIRIFFEKARSLHFDFRNFSGVRFAVVGSGTREMLHQYGFEADYYPEHYTTIALAEGLRDRAGAGERLLIPRALRGSKEMLKVLDEANIAYKELLIYDVVGKRTDNWQYLEDFDVITFASGSGAEAFAKEVQKDMEIALWEERRKKAGTKLAAIGEMTAKVLASHGLSADIIPTQCDSRHLIQAVREYYEK